jgi:hypothetical protein
MQKESEFDQWINQNLTAPGVTPERAIQLETLRAIRYVQISIEDCDKHLASINTTTTLFGILLVLGLVIGLVSMCAH